MDEGLKLARTFRLNDVEILHFLTGPTGRAFPSGGPSCRPAHPSAALAYGTGPTPRSHGTTCSRPSASCGIAMP